jgi:lysozyme
VGAYHFFTLCRSGAKQARHFLATVPPDSRALPPAVDLETAGNCSRRPSQADVRREIGAFLTRVEAAWHRKVRVYIRDDFDSRYPGSDGGRPGWVFRFLRRPSEKNWVIWQLHGFARVEGISGRVDLDVMRSRAGS